MKIYKILFSLCAIQRLAYQPDDKRCSRDVLHFYLQATTFSTGYCETFPSNDLKKIKTRAMYGNPFHSLIAHMADLYRIISLRSINTEERGRTYFEYNVLYQRFRLSSGFSQWFRICTICAVTVDTDRWGRCFLYWNYIPYTTNQIS